MSGGIYPGTAVDRDLERRCDVCIIGSGPGGSVVARSLAQAGLRVVLLEEGGYYPRSQLKQQEEWAFPALYQDRGLRATADAAISILQGRTVGGGTVINWTTSYRTPRAVLDHWARVHGVEGLDEATLNPHWEAIEQRLNIREVAEGYVNANNDVLWRGATALGYGPHKTRRNVDGCVNSGYCGLGCPADGKMDMRHTELRDALRAGLTLLCDVRVERLELEHDRVRAVHAHVLDRATGRATGPTVRILPRVAVLSAGAINSPAVLLRSGLNPNGRAGRRTFLHPVVASGALFEQVINGFYGAPQSVACHHFIDRGQEIGFFLESAPIQPMLAATAFKLWGRPLEEAMARLPHTNVVIALTTDGFLPDDDGGTVTVLRDGRPRLDYPLSPKRRRAFREAARVMARIQLAAGAREVRPLNALSLRSEADLARLDEMAFEPLEVNLFSAHQMGGCAMGGDASTSVVDSRFRHHQVPNLFVVDGSVLPTSLGVNPMETILGLASHASRFVGEAAG